MKDKEKKQKYFPTFIEIDLTDAPDLSDGDCSHYRIKNESQFPPNEIFFCLSSQLGRDCCSHCMLECNPNFGM